VAEEALRCERCGGIVGNDSPAWVELSDGRLRILVLAEFDDPEPARRVWHARCFGG
jgi:hypothetical protein